MTAVNCQRSSCEGELKDIDTSQEYIFIYSTPLRPR